MYERHVYCSSVSVGQDTYIERLQPIRILWAFRAFQVLHDSTTYAGSASRPCSIEQTVSAFRFEKPLPEPKCCLFPRYTLSLGIRLSTPTCGIEKAGETRLRRILDGTDIDTRLQQVVAVRHAKLRESPARRQSSYYYRMVSDTRVQANGREASRALEIGMFFHNGYLISTTRCLSIDNPPKSPICSQPAELKSTAF